MTVLRLPIGFTAEDEANIAVARAAREHAQALGLDIAEAHPRAVLDPAEVRRIRAATIAAYNESDRQVRQHLTAETPLP